jgi:N-hydroxyarylamine O-acetyltransferase
MNLDAYLQRIGWDGETAATLDTLTALLHAHMTAIPFENLDVLLGRPIRLDLTSLQQKLVGARRGGYCFEHTTLFAAALEELGFQPVRHSARVLLFSPRSESPRTHMFLTVSLPQGTFIVDPGFGGPAALFPIPLVDQQGHPGDATHWMVRDGDFWVLRTRQGEGPSDAWASTLEHDYPIDFEMASHFVSTHSSSPFVNRIMMSRFTPNGRVTVMNRDVAVTEAGKTQSFQLSTKADLRALLVRHFGFDLPEVEEIQVPSMPKWAV